MNKGFLDSLRSLGMTFEHVETREAIIEALEAASHNPEVPKFNVGILQT